MNLSPSMRRPCSALAILCLSVVTATTGWGQSSAFPDTVAGNVLAAWLEAFNSSDPSLLSAYVEQYEPGLSYPEEVQRSEISGGFDLASIERSLPLEVEFVVNERRSGARRLGRFVLSEQANESVIVSRYLSAAPVGSALLGFEIDAETRAAVVQRAAQTLREFHMHPRVGEAMATDLEERHRDGEYDQLADGARFASLLTDHLQESGGDTHISLRFTATLPPDRPPPRNPNAMDEVRELLGRVNCGFRKAEVRPGNVGYLKVNMFESADFCATTGAIAMDFLKNVRALIIDLRESTGGQPNMVAYMASYFFADQTHIIDIRTPSTDEVEEHWTQVDMSGELPSAVPVYILTSSHTHSGAEMFVAALKSRGRATVIGETTRGGAQLVASHVISEQFRILVPRAEAINPTTSSNWSGTGIEPHILVDADEALEAALQAIGEADALQRP